jgi:5-methylcytosine-specific restriction endonuclease McrA/uncharacterized protein (DUF433 family)
MAQKDSYDFEAKQIYRGMWRDFISKQHPSEKRRRGLRVACFPGPEALEVLEVYDRLGIRRDRIWGIEHNRGDYERLCALNLGINPVYGDAQAFFERADAPQFDVVNLDFQSQMKEKEKNTIQSIVLNAKCKRQFLLGTNFCGNRESEVAQERISNTAFALGNGQNELYLRSIGAPENLIDSLFVGTGECEQRKIDHSLRDQYISTGLIDALSSNIYTEDMVTHKVFLDMLLEGRSIEEVVGEFPEDRHELEFVRMGVAYFGSIVQQRLSQHDLTDEEKRIIYYHTILSHLKRPYFIKDFHKGQYTSDNGTPMFFDFIKLSLEDDLVSKYSVHNIFADRDLFVFIEENGLKPGDYSQDSNVGVFPLSSRQMPSFGITAIPKDYEELGDMVKMIPILAASEGEKFSEGELSADEKVLFEMFSRKWRVFLLGNRGNYFQFLSEISKRGSQEAIYGTTGREHVHVKTLDEKIRDDLQAGVPEDEILEKYDIDKRKLGANKATLARMTGVSRKKSCPKIQGERLEGLLDRIDAGEEDDVLKEEYNLSKMQLAFYKGERKRRDRLNGTAQPVENDSDFDKELLLEMIAEGVEDDWLMQEFNLSKMALAYWKGEPKRRETRKNGGNGEAKFRDYILERDDYTCQMPDCGRTQAENLEESGHGLHVHHIDYNHDNNVPENGVALCVSCHAKTNLHKHAEEMRGVLEDIVLEKELEKLEAVESEPAEEVPAETAA